MIGAGADGFLDLLLRVGERVLLAHDGGDRAAALAEQFQHHAVGFAQHHLESLVVDRLERRDIAQQALADAVLGAPALERGDDVLGGDRRAVVEFEPVPQSESIGETVGADLVLADHLRLRLLVGVVAEQRVVDQRAMDVGDGLRGPDRIDHAHIGVHHGAQHLFLVLRHRRQRQDERDKADQQSEHPVSPKTHKLPMHKLCKAARLSSHALADRERPARS